MKLLKPAKILSFCTVVGLCTYYSIQLQSFAVKELQLYERKIAAKIIEADLSGKDLTIDIKDKKTKPAEKLTIDDMRKALWILRVQNEQLQYSLDSVRSALDYKGEE